MKKIMFLITFSALLLSSLTASGDQEMQQKPNTDVFSIQDQKLTATTIASTRLFAEKEDLTSVILVVPSGAVVEVLGSDSTYYRIIFDDAEGFIFKRHARLDPAPKETAPVVQQNVQPQENQDSRLAYLQKKYGHDMAERLYAGKIWKGMTSQMVQDSWGPPIQVNSSVNTTPVRYEWVYKSSCLYIENNTLVNWGPLRK